MHSGEPFPGGWIWTVLGMMTCDFFQLFVFFKFFEIPWEPHLVMNMTESLPSGVLRQKSTPQPDALWEYHLVKIESKSLPDGPPRVFQKI